MNATNTSRGQLFSALHTLADEITTEKTAAARAKQASPTPSDPGGYQGASSHPTTKVDNRGQASSEGARSSENVSDVNADQGAPGVNKAPDAKPGQQDDVQLNIGTSQSATGEDPAVEDDYKGGKDDPGTTHPAATDNSSLDGHKYASANFDQLYRLNGELANGILADLANGFGNQLTKQALDSAAAGKSGGLNPSAAGSNPPNKPKMQAQGQPPAGEKTANAAGTATGLEDMIKKAADAVRAGKVPSNAPAAQNTDLAAGYELAEYLGLEKAAAQRVVGECIELTLQDSYKDADIFGSYLQQHMRKQAAGSEDGSSGEDHSKDGDDTSGANGAEGTSGESCGSGGGGGAGGGKGGGGGDTLGDMLGGGSDPGGLMGGGGGSPPSGGGGPMGGGGGGPSEEQALMELVAALDELGIPIEELAAAGGGGGGTGGPPMGGGMGGPPMGGGDPLGGGGAPPMGAPPMGGDPMGGGGAPPMGEGMKLASAAKAFRRSGRYQFKQAGNGTPERALRNQMKGHIMELMAYNR